MITTVEVVNMGTGVTVSTSVVSDVRTTGFVVVLDSVMVEVLVTGITVRLDCLVIV